MPPPPGCLPPRIKGFYDCHIMALSPPTCALPPRRADPQQYIHHIMLNPVASTAPWQCLPLCPDSSNEEQSGSIARSNCIKRCPSTSSAPTTTAWAPNRAFGLPLYIQQRCCNPLHTMQSSAAVHQCTAGWRVSCTPRIPCWMMDRFTGSVAPDEVRAPMPSDSLHGYERLQA
jgi:hypothetical protein